MNWWGGHSSDHNSDIQASVCPPDLSQGTDFIWNSMDNSLSKGVVENNNGDVGSEQLM